MYVLVTEHEFSRKVGEAFAQGSRWEIVSPEEFEFGVCASYGILRGCYEAYARSSHWVHIDHPYWEHLSWRNVGWDNAYFRVCVDRLWHPSKPDSSRWDKYHSLVKDRPWNQGDDIIVVPPSPYMEKYLQLEDWLETTVEEIQHHTDRKIIISRKGESRVEDLLPAWCVVTDHSNAGIYALTEGTPVIYTNPQRKLGEIENIESPPRDRSFFARLSQGIFTLDDMRSGKTWDYCQQFIVGSTDEKKLLGMSANTAFSNTHRFL